MRLRSSSPVRFRLLAHPLLARPLPVRHRFLLATAAILALGVVAGASNVSGQPSEGRRTPAGNQQMLQSGAGGESAAGFAETSSAPQTGDRRMPVGQATMNGTAPRPMGNEAGMTGLAPAPDTILPGSSTDFVMGMEGGAPGAWGPEADSMTGMSAAPAPRRTPPPARTAAPAARYVPVGNQTLAAQPMGNSLAAPLPPVAPLPAPQAIPAAAAAPMPPTAAPTAPVDWQDTPQTEVAFPAEALPAESFPSLAPAFAPDPAAAAYAPAPMMDAPAPAMEPLPEMAAQPASYWEKVSAFAAGRAEQSGTEPSLGAPASRRPVNDASYPNLAGPAAPAPLQRMGTADMESLTAARTDAHMLRGQEDAATLPPTLPTSAPPVAAHDADDHHPAALEAFPADMAGRPPLPWQTDAAQPAAEYAVEPAMEHSVERSVEQFTQFTEQPPAPVYAPAPAYAAAPLPLIERTPAPVAPVAATDGWDDLPQPERMEVPVAYIPAGSTVDAAPLPPMNLLPPAAQEPRHRLIPESRYAQRRRAGTGG